MYTVTARNVNGALEDVLWRIRSSNVKEESRNGPVLRLPGPLVLTYTHPWERVLWSPTRNANPFFHLMESLWMLAGRNDVAFPARFVKHIRTFSDDGVTLHGAYGRRWRYWGTYGADQLQEVINQLRADPTTRRAVLTMWEPSMDLWAPPTAKDVPCNLICTFQYTQGALDLCVFNRSNDVVWGMCGANAVHMSFLHEYVANAAGLEQGRYHQISANAHVYCNEQGQALISAPPVDMRLYNGVDALRLPKDLRKFNEDLYKFMAKPDAYTNARTVAFQECVIPIMMAWRLHEEGATAKAATLLRGASPYDWVLACMQWLERRLASR